MNKECEDFLKECKESIETKKADERRKNIRRNKLITWLFKKEFPTIELTNEEGGIVDICGYKLKIERYLSCARLKYIYYLKSIDESSYHKWITNKEDFCEFLEQEEKINKRNEAYYSDKNKVNPDEKGNYPLVFFSLFIIVIIPLIIVLSNR